MAGREIVDEVGGKVAIVTGAASGIGRSVVELFVERGAKVIAVDRDEKVGDLASDTVVPLKGDVTVEQTADDAVQLAVSSFGQLDILVNNAGYINYQSVVDTSLDEWEKVMSINSTGYFLFSRAAVKEMMRRKKGAIVNIASYASYFAFKDIAPYAASKGAVAQLTRALSLEAIEHGIRVNAVGSGNVVTNLLDTFRDDGREFLSEHGKAAPIGRAAQPREIAEIVAFLASERASFVVGSIVMADGGFSVQIA